MHCVRRNPIRTIRLLALAAVVVAACLDGGGSRLLAAPIRILFLGDRDHHRPADRFAQLQPVFAARGIEMTYVDRASALSAANLAGYDGLMIYANLTEIRPEEEQALLDYVAGGKGFIPLHCASYCFLNSAKYVELVGAQFQRHGTGVFRTTNAANDHPLMKDYRGFESWDETYVHHRHNDRDRTILEFRVDKDGREPWTWVRTHGKGRVFYTAWGHDHRTWSNAGFQNLVERGVRWAVGADLSVVPAFADQPEMTPLRSDAAPFDYADAEVPFYPAGEKWGTTGEPIKKMQKPLPPTASMSHMVTPTNFEVRLFVAEDQFQGKPIAMNWDERGRLWVLETNDYPNDMQSAGQGHDRIRICEDSDGDGRADKFTVFADALSIPTSLIFAQGGVVVHQAPDTLFLKDTNGDDVADERRVLFTGWGTRDTHAGPSNLRYGLDNWLYGISGYSGFRGRVGDEQLGFGSGFHRLKPDGSKLEFLRSTNNNSWGVGFSEEGILFGSTANNNPSEYLPIPNRYYERVRGWSSTVLSGIAESPRMFPITDKVRQVDQHGNFTAAAGHALYTARNYPREYWNRASFVAEPEAHLIATFQISPDGANFSSRNSWNLLASDDEWTAPIMAEVGPDGNVWVIDWYNYIVQHNPTPAGYQTGKGAAYVTDLRDKTHGRVYRIVPAGSGAARPFSLAGASPEQLVATLKNDNMFWRNHAQRLLVERGKPDVVPALIQLAGDASVDAIGLNPGAIHALWTLHGLGVLDGQHAEAAAAAVGALKHPSAGVRRNAVQVLPLRAESVASIRSAGLLRDPHPQVRLATLLALAEQPDAEALGAELAQLANEASLLRDRWLPDALISAAAAHHGDFLAAAVRLPASAAASPAKANILERVAEHQARLIDAQGVTRLLAALPQAPPSAAAAIISGWAKGWPKDRRLELDEAADRSLVEFAKQLTGPAQSQLVSLAARWGSQSLTRFASEIAETLLAQATSAERPEADRASAAAQLIEFRRDDARLVGELLNQITPKTSPELAAGLIEAVSKSEAAGAAALMLENLGGRTPAVRSALLRALLSRGDWTTSLVEAVEQGAARFDDLSLDQKQRLAAHPNPQIARRAKAILARGGGLPNADRQKVVEEFAALIKPTADPIAGKTVFKNQCVKCHIHSGEGNRIGPDLTGMAVHPKHELLVHLLDPSRSVEGNFRSYTATTSDGQVVTGLLASETKTSVELLDAENKRHLILREDIDELVASPKSLMPEGFEKQVSQTDILNLLEFLTQRGKYLPLPLDKVATIVSTRGMFFSEERDVERMIFDEWTPKTVEGVPFILIDPQGARIPNVVMLNGPQGVIPPRMPKSVTVACNAPAKAIHLLSGVSGWGFPGGRRGDVSMTVRFHYADGQTEDHALKNGEHFADYIRRVDVPGSKFAFDLHGTQLRYLSVAPRRIETIKEIELIKGSDATAPLVMAMTLEGP